MAWTPASFEEDPPAAAPAKAWTPASFEPDEEEPGIAETALHHGAQGLTLNLSDEAAGLWGMTKHNLQSIAAGLRGESAGPPGESYVEGMKRRAGAAVDAFRGARDEERATLDATERAHPNVALGSNLVAGVAGAALTGGASMGLKGAAAMGALSGFGSSRADNAGEQVQDALLGAGTGVVAHGIGKGIGKVLGFPGSLARKGLATAEAEVAAKGREGVGEAIHRAAGVYGGEKQVGNRIVENLRNLGPEMSPAQAAKYASLQGIRANLGSELIDANLRDLPGQAGVIAQKQMAMDAMLQNKTAIENAAIEGLKLAGPKQLLNAPANAAGGSLKNMAIGNVGLGIGALLGSPLGPAGAVVGGQMGQSAAHSLAGVLVNPEARRTLYLGMGKLLAAPDALGKYAPSLAAAYARGPDALAATHAVLLKRDPEYQRTLDQAQGGQ